MRDSIEIVYPIGSSGQEIRLSVAVLAKFRRYRQLHWCQREAGGQLFARFNGRQIIVEDATGPRRSDRRSRTGYFPDRVSEQLEIEERFRRGLNFIGDWHTHPERYPVASGPDCQSIGDCVRRSKHRLNGFVMIVVGQAEAPEGLSVSIHDGLQRHPLAHQLSPPLTQLRSSWTVAAVARSQT